MKWVIHKFFFLILPIKYAIPTDWHRSEDHIVCLIQPIIVNLNPGEQRIETIDPNRNDQDYILEEEVNYEI